MTVTFPADGLNPWGAPMRAALALLAERAYFPVDARDYGARLDGRRIDYPACTAASTTVNATDGNFTAADLGKIAMLYDENGDSVASATPRTIAAVNSPTQITLSGAPGVTLNGQFNHHLVVATDDGPAIQAAVNAARDRLAIQAVLGAGPNQSAGAGRSRVIVDTGRVGGYVGTTQQITIPPSVRLHCPSFLLNAQADRYAPVVVFQRYSAFDELFIEAAWGAGVQLGTATGTQAVIRGTFLEIWHTSRTTEVGGAARPCVAVDVYGQDFMIGCIWLKNAAIGLRGNEASDFMLGLGMFIGCRIGARILNSNQFHGRFVFDTCGDPTAGAGGVGIIFDNNCSDCSAEVQAFEVVGVVNILDAVVDIGPTSANLCQSIKVDVMAQRTGGAGLRVGYAKDTTARLHCSNAVAPATGGSNITTGVIYGTGMAGYCDVEAKLDGNITNAWTGAKYGAYDYVLGTGARTFATPLSTLDRTYLYAPPTAPTAANMAASQVSFSVDEAANTIKITVKYSNGTTVKTFTGNLV